MLQSLATLVGKAPRHLHWVARLGYLIKGVLYVTIGGLALATVLGLGGALTDSKGALEYLFQQPYGQALLILTGVGLFSYAGWKLCQSVLDIEARGSEAKAVAQRVGIAISGAMHAALGYRAFAIVADVSSNGDTQRGWIAALLSSTLGRCALIALAVGWVGVGVYQGARAFRADLRKRLRREAMSERLQTWIVRFGKAGLMARSIVFVLIGTFIFSAVWRYDPDAVGGMDKALTTIARQPYGPWLLTGVAAGIALYGAYCLARARYRKIPA